MTIARPAEASETAHRPASQPLGRGTAVACGAAEVAVVLGPDGRAVGELAAPGGPLDPDRLAFLAPLVAADGSIAGRLVFVRTAVESVRCELPLDGARRLCVELMAKVEAPTRAVPELFPAGGRLGEGVACVLGGVLGPALRVAALQESWEIAPGRVPDPVAAAALERCRPHLLHAGLGVFEGGALEVAEGSSRASGGVAAGPAPGLRVRIPGSDGAGRAGTVVEPAVTVVCDDGELAFARPADLRLDAPPDPDAGLPPFEPGSDVEGPGARGEYRRAVVSERLGCVYRLAWADGGEGSWVRRARVRRPPPPRRAAEPAVATAPAGAAPPALEPGRRVVVSWPDGQRHAGTLTHVQGDYGYVAWDAGGAAWVHASTMRVA
ncbi:MAG: hypothetical protein IT373_15355 [Polyangiaceae bacterium]|nr:hypothetical protein [Polyangiaceae bacterium]